MILEVKNLAVSYGVVKALNGISFYVEEGEIVTLIGSNGAGKTTTLRTISGLEKAKSGSIVFNGKNITRELPHKIVELGISHVPEGRRIFTNLTVMDNILLGANLRKDKNGIKKDIEMIFDIFPRLKERSKQMASTLSGGEQQMLAIGRALITRGKMMLLDEPSMGLAPLVINSIFEVIKEINRQGTTVFLVEQNASMALRTAHRCYVLEMGNIVKEGIARELLYDKAIKDAYLGG